MECLSSFLQQAPKQTVSTRAAREHLNVNERTLKRVYEHMRAGKFIELSRCPLEEVDPGAGPRLTKKGDQVQVTCLKLLKPYKGKAIVEEDDDEEEEEEPGIRVKGRIMERDMVSQSYDVVVSSGTKGISQRALGCRLNVGKLEFRMLCRKLERDGAVKGFMEDVGRQRTTKYISHRCVGSSNHLQMFAKEQERKDLFTSAPQTFDTLSTSHEAPAPSQSLGTESLDKELQKDETGDAEDGQTSGNGEPSVEALTVDKTVPKAGRKTPGKEDGVKNNLAKCEKASTDLTPAEGRSGVFTKREDNRPSASESVPADDAGSSVPQTEVCRSSAKPADDDRGVTEEVQQEDTSAEASRSQSCTPKQENVTYRVLKRKNLIIEAVRNFKVIESLFQLQKLISDEEKQDGYSAKCCKKTIVRHIQSLAREGLVKLYTTTVIQDGISKKVEMVVHPSIQPSDDIVKKAIEQVRYKITTSMSSVHQQQSEDQTKLQRSVTQEMRTSSSKTQKHTPEKKVSRDTAFHPIRVQGISKTLGFQPKMHRLGVAHSFLWYIIYGHPLKGTVTEPDGTVREPDGTSHTPGDSNDGDPAENSDTCEKEDVSHAGGSEDAHSSIDTDRQTQASEFGCKDAPDPQPVSSPLSNMDGTSLDGEEEMLKEESNTTDSQPASFKEYCEEDSWRKFIPPLRPHRHCDDGWALINDLILCLPLSIFLQIIQITYKVDGLDEYLNHPVKQHYLLRVLPVKIRLQLFHKRKYLFSFYENLQRLAYMGLLHFGPVTKFQEKLQGLVYLKRNATVVDTTSAEPHYFLVTESPDSPFVRRYYTFNTAKDVENYWFDLKCVCLNTPLGLIRRKRGGSEEEAEPFVARDRSVFPALAYLLKGSKEVCDDGSIPGDGKGAGGLDSEFFAHLKRNWFWTSHLHVDNPNDAATTHVKTKLSRVSQSNLKSYFKPGELTASMYVTAKNMQLGETVEMALEPATRNQQVVGGKRQKRKRSKKELVKVPRKKKKGPRIRTSAHDEADHQALKMMTKRRVSWSVQEDALMILCSVASYLLNAKLKRPFIPHCVIRDLLQAEFEKSCDKTSLAVGRRKRYILKNPQTLLNYRIWLAEVHQDKALMDLLEEKKPANPDRAEDCAAALSDYTRLLRQKFRSSAADPCDTIMPDTKHQMVSRFKVCAIEDGKQMSFIDFINSTADIHAIVLYNLMQSSLAMTNYQMKSCRSFQTFHTYNKYSEELLFQVFIKCRKTGLVNRRRVNIKEMQKKRALPILPMSYQLSQSYYRSFSWRFPRTLYNELLRFMKNLTARAMRDDRPVTAFYHETKNRTENGEDVLERTSKKKPDAPSEGEKSKVLKEGGKDQGGEPKQNEPNRENGDDVACDFANTQSAREQIGDHPVHDEEETEGTSGDAPADAPENAPEDAPENAPEDAPADAPVDAPENAPADAPEDAPVDAPEDAPENAPVDAPENAPEDAPVDAPVDAPEDAPEDAPVDAPEEYPDVSDMLRYSLDSLGGSCAAVLSLMTLGLLSVHVSIPKQIVVVDSNLVDDTDKSGMAALMEDDDDDDDGEECEGKKRMEVKSHQASHTKYLMMRGYCCPGIVKMRDLNTNDNIVVDSCIMRLQLRSTRGHNLFEDDFSPLALLESGPSLLPSILTFSIHSRSAASRSVELSDRRLIDHSGYSPQDVEACSQLRSSLEEAGEKGVDVTEFYRVHRSLVEPQSGRTRSLQQYMQDLEEDGQVLRVGGRGVRWVLMKHADPWLLTVNPQIWSRLNTDERPVLKNLNRSSLQRKRSLRSHPDPEEPLAKKVAGCQEEMEELPSETTGDGESKDKVLERRKTSGNEGEEKSETVEEHHETRDKEVCPTPVAPDDPDEEETLSFVSRPWRMVDGMLNRQVCKGMLEGVLFHIMSLPGLTQRTLMEHYRDVLQPVVVLDLVQALIELGCVKKKTLVQSPKPSLFSRSVRVTRGEAGAMTEHPDAVFYEPTISCCVRLAWVLPNERHWNHLV